MILDLDILKDEPEALAKITEAVAKVYFANVNKTGYDINPVSDAYRKLFCLNPNYRIILKGKPGFEKYNFLDPLYAEITSLPVDSIKPQIY